MISKINGTVGFGSQIVRNDYLNQGFAEAREYTHTDYRYNANEFANSLSYLKNDSKDDVYEVIKDIGVRAPKFRLIKNGEEVKAGSYDNAGRAVVDLFTNYVKFDLGKEIAKPFTKSMDQKVNLADLDICLDNARASLDEVQKRADKCRKFVNKFVTQELEEKIDKLDMSI